VCKDTNLPRGEIEQEMGALRKRLAALDEASCQNIIHGKDIRGLETEHINSVGQRNMKNNIAMAASASTRTTTITGSDPKVSISCPTQVNLKRQQAVVAFPSHLTRDIIVKKSINCPVDQLPSSSLRSGPRDRPQLTDITSVHHLSGTKNRTQDLTRRLPLNTGRGIPLETRLPSIKSAAATNSHPQPGAAQAMHYNTAVGQSLETLDEPRSTYKPLVIRSDQAVVGKYHTMSKSSLLKGNNLPGRRLYSLGDELRQPARVPGMYPQSENNGGGNPDRSVDENMKDEKAPVQCTETVTSRVWAKASQGQLKKIGYVLYLPWAYWARIGPILDPGSEYWEEIMGNGEGALLAVFLIAGGVLLASALVWIMRLVALLGTCSGMALGMTGRALEFLFGG
jgi:hypothetical protein